MVFFGLIVFLFICLYGVIFGPLVFYLFGPLDSIYGPAPNFLLKFNSLLHNWKLEPCRSYSNLKEKHCPKCAFLFLTSDGLSI